MVRGIALLAAVLSVGAQSDRSDRIDLGGGVALEIVRIPAGAFEMGSPAGETGRGPDEDLHRVTIAEDFWIGRAPVTRGQFARFVQETNYKTESESGPSGGFGFDGTALVQRKEFTWRNPGFVQTDDHPVVIVTYEDALAFTRWLARKSGRKVALPTEAQWEYACRAGTTSRFYSGDSDADAERIGWFRKNAGKGTHPVGVKAANPWGLVDMSGNVYQWCSDLYAAYVPGGGEQGPMDKPRRVLRGGSWLKDAKHVRSAARARNTPGSRNADNGFRVVVGPKAAGPVPAPAKTTPDVPPPPPPPEKTSTESAPVEFPSADPEPYSPRRARSSDSGCITPLVIIVLVTGILVVVVAVLAFRKRGLPQQQMGPPRRMMSGPTPRIGDDGFWFDTSGYSPGDRIRYTYMGPNGMVTEYYVVEPGMGEQFIYTGVRPTDVMLAQMIANQMNQQPPPPPPPSYQPPPSSRRRDDDDDDDRPRRHPPAY